MLPSYSLDTQILFWLIISTMFIAYLCLRNQHSLQIKLLIVMMLTGVFFYSGYGISYQVVNNRYTLKYVIFILSLCLPFILGKNIDEGNDFSELDIYLNKNKRLIKKLAVAFLVCYFIPLIYPEFKLFNIITNPGFRLDNLWEERWAFKENPIIVMIDAIKAFLTPFFFIYLTQLQSKKVNNIKVVFLYCCTVLMLYMRYSYLGRYQMIVFGLIIYFLVFCVRGYDFKIGKKNIITIILIVLSLIPFLYTYTFLRIGQATDMGLSFKDIASLLIYSESYYPIYYDVAVNSPVLQEQTPWTFILWIIFLPIPSFLFPDKPTLQGDAFTYAITGKSFGDTNFSSSLPSVLGESFMYFGDEFYWIEGLIIGLIIYFIMKYLLSHKCLNFYAIYLIVFVLTLGRGGAASYMSTIINGTLAIFLLHFYVKLVKN